MYCKSIALFVAIFGSLLATKINGSTLPPPVDQNTNKTTIAPNNGEFDFLDYCSVLCILSQPRSLFTYCASHKHFVPDKKMICIQ